MFPDEAVHAQKFHFLDHVEKLDIISKLYHEYRTFVSRLNMLINVFVITVWFTDKHEYKPRLICDKLDKFEYFDCMINR